MELYNSILKLCQQKGISITTMCKAAGVSRGSLGDLKSGKNKSLSAEALAKVADYFCVTVDYLLGKEETKKAPRANEELIEKLLNEASKKAVVVMFGGDGPKVVEIPPEAEETVKRMLEAIDKKNTN